MTPTAGFPVTVASAVPAVTCPVPGLDRCNNGNDLRSATVAVDDTNASHIYVTYAENTGAGNENVLVQDSIDGGTHWTRDGQWRRNRATLHAVDLRDQRDGVRIMV